jgi:hypothetical protein
MCWLKSRSGKTHCALQGHCYQSIPLDLRLVFVSSVNPLLVREGLRSRSKRPRGRFEKRAPEEVRFQIRFRVEAPEEVNS